MKKIILLFTAFVFALQYGVAQDTTSSALLWEISGKNVKSPSYLFGTMHLIPKKDFLFPQMLQDKVKSSDVLVMEIGGLSDKMKAMQYMMLDSGSVYDYFSKEQQDSLFKYTAENLEMDKDKMMQFSGMKPIVLLQLITKNEFGEAPESYELEFEKIANTNEVKIIGLETIEEQMRFLDNLSPKDQVNMVMETIRGGDKDKSQTHRLVDNYLTQDIEKIHSFIVNSDMNSPEFEETMLNNRNKRWIEPIRKIIKKNKAFIAVGAGHLGGPNGVIELLKKKGYTLKPIKL